MNNNENQDWLELAIVLALILVLGMFGGFALSILAIQAIFW
jgi:uncharacterized protein YneF (UPF0154 family)